MRLSDVCLSRTSGLSREQRGLGRTKIGTEVAHVSWLGHHFQGQNVKGQGHQAALLSAALTRNAAAAVSVRTYSAWESTATLSARRRASGLGAHGEERGGAYCVATRTAC